MDDASEDSRPAQPGIIKKFFTTLSQFSSNGVFLNELLSLCRTIIINHDPARFQTQRYQKFLDSTVPHLPLRWITTFVLMILFLIRIFYLQGWYIVTYALGIYQLNLFIAFLTPKIDPALEELEDDGPELPTKADQEFRPFIRRLPEFKFWYAATRAVVIAITCTFFEFFNIPVFWPILVMYFIVLFIITMKRQIKHMIKYRYLPFTYGKQKYRGKEDTGDVMKS